MERFNQVIGIVTRPDGLLVAVTERFDDSTRPLIFYSLDRNLKVTKVELSTRFRNFHSELTTLRHLDHALTEAEEMAFREVKYWK